MAKQVDKRFSGLYFRVFRYIYNSTLLKKNGIGKTLFFLDGIWT